jgi:hypothetical protein
MESRMLLNEVMKINWCFWRSKHWKIIIALMTIETVRFTFDFQWRRTETVLSMFYAHFQHLSFSLTLAIWISSFWRQWIAFINYCMRNLVCNSYWIIYVTGCPMSFKRIHFHKSFLMIICLMSFCLKWLISAISDICFAPQVVSSLSTYIVGTD